MAEPAAFNHPSGAVTTTAPGTQNIPTATQYPVSPVPYPPTAQYPPPAGGYPPAQYPPPAQFQPVAQYSLPPPPGDKKAGDENSSAEKYGPLFD